MPGRMDAKLLMLIEAGIAEKNRKILNILQTRPSETREALAYRRSKFGGSPRGSTIPVGSR